MKKTYGLIGRTLKHSYSALIHSELGVADYELKELEPHELQSFLSRDDIGGYNVTIPYKKDVMKCCGRISAEAQAIGSVNTLVKEPDGVLCGYNTDFYGFCAMARRAGITFSGRKVLILGSGGASLTVKAAAAAENARETVVISRSGKDNYENLHKHYDADIIVNTTPVGMFPNADKSPIDLLPFKKLKGVLDLIYNPCRTRLILQAQELKIPCSDGLYMLVAQAKAAEELFFGKKIPDSETDRIYKLMRCSVQNIVLIGMPGCGKNTVGAALSKISGRELVDIDENIVKTAGRSIESIFEKSGEEEFRRLEREETLKAGMMSGKIIMTGGGVVKDTRNYPSLKMNGRIYHIEREINLLSRNGRPLSKNADLGAMYKERLPMYSALRDSVVENSGTPEDAAEKIWRDYVENTCD